MSTPWLAPEYGRSSRNFRRLAAAVRARRAPCALCGQAIDYTLHRYHPRSFTVDHKLSRDQYPHLAEDPGNLQPAHRDCNSRKRTGPGKPGLGPTSERW